MIVPYFRQEEQEKEHESRYEKYKESSREQQDIRIFAGW